MFVIIRYWQLWKKLEEAYQQGLAQQETHPFLPVDASEGNKLYEVLKNELKIDKADYIKARADFVSAKGQVFGSERIDFLVKWIVIEGE